MSLKEVLLSNRGDSTKTLSNPYAFASEDDEQLGLAAEALSGRAKKVYEKLGRPIGGNQYFPRWNRLLHPFGDDDIISRWYTVIWGSVTLITSFFAVIDPDLIGFTITGEEEKYSSPILEALVFLLDGLAQGLLLVNILRVNRPTQAMWSPLFGSVCVMLLDILCYIGLSYAIHLYQLNPGVSTALQIALNGVRGLLAVIGTLYYLWLQGKHIYCRFANIRMKTFSEQQRERHKRVTVAILNKKSPVVSSAYAKEYKGNPELDRETQSSWYQEYLDGIVNYFKSIGPRLRDFGWMIKDRLRETDNFTYPPAMMLAVTITPILLLWLFLKIYTLSDPLAMSLTGFQDTFIAVDNIKVYADVLKSCCKNSTCVYPADLDCNLGLPDSQAGSLIVGLLFALGEVSDGLGISNIATSMGNFPDAFRRGLRGGAAVSLVITLIALCWNLAGFKKWTLHALEGRRVPGFNVTSERISMDVARSAEFLAVFISTHLFAMATATVVLSTVFTAFGWNRLQDIISNNSSFLASYLIMYILVYFILKMFVGNRILSEKGQIPKRPRSLTDFIFCLCAWYIINGIFAAVSRMALYLPFFFLSFCRLDSSPFPPYFQEYDVGYRSCQSLIAYHTRTQNPLVFCFAEHLFQSNGSFRARALNPAGFGRFEEAEVSKSSRRVRNKWHLATTLINNPSLCAYRRRYSDLQ